ncbi:GNAT family N-acetyltransferase [Desulfovibrio sp. SGI.169]|uniref:GNAT family N-acetyltransferase n=1 Tax=Desulfovibrio sp. SGI.169 TaxID=3420561 RepID=UPI003D091BD5
MKLRYRQCLGKRARAALFRQMQEEGLLPFAMSAWAKPTLRDWLALTSAGGDASVLLRCEDESGRVLGCGLFTRQPYRVWHFDFTAFRAGFAVAAQQARGGFAWMFRRQDCTSVMGVCPLPNRHAWRLAEACGFRILARLPRACFYARKGTYVDGVLVLCTREAADKGQQPRKSGAGCGFAAP